MEDLWLDCFQWPFGDVLNLPTMTDGLNIAAVRRSKPESQKEERDELRWTPETGFL